MNILLLGSGGREHALGWKISQSNMCGELCIAPGNAGTAQVGENVNIQVTDFEAIKAFCIQKKIMMLVVGPEEPLVMGIYDYFKSDAKLKNIMVIGPSAAAAQLEGSKAFSKQFMQRYNIPTATYAEFDSKTFNEGLQYLEQHSLPVVIKADGLAAGKGVVICNSVDEAKQAFKAMLKEKQFGEAGAKVIVEQFLNGIELSVFVLTDGYTYKIIGHAKDYKRIGEGDTGLNTGGMGCISPVPFADKNFMEKVEIQIILPTMRGIMMERLEYKGFIFFGLMNVNGEPYLIEYNCRMGDPETEVVIPKLKNDLVEMFVSLWTGNLKKHSVKFDKRVCSTIVAVSEGYPGSYKNNCEIWGLKELENDDFGAFGSGNSVLVFHSGTKQSGEKVVTNGGRVVAVTAFGGTINHAVSTSLDALGKLGFNGMYFRKDIGYEWRQQ